MGILIALFILLFLLLLLSMPILVRVRARLGVRGAVVHARLYLLGLIPVPIRLRVYLLQKPYFTLCIGKKRIRLGSRSGGAGGAHKGVRAERLCVSVTVGVRDDPAGATVLAGTLGVLFSMLVPAIAGSVTVAVHPIRRPMLRLSLDAFLIAQPPVMIAGVLHKKRIARAKDANNRRIPKEKRTEYASC